MGRNQEVDKISWIDRPRRKRGGEARQSGSSVQSLDRGARWSCKRPRRSFPANPAIVRTLPDPIDQMKLFELIQIIPSPTRPLLGRATLPTTGFQSRESWDICETTVFSR